MQLTGEVDDRIRVLAVDDHPMLREGIAAILKPQPDMALIAEAEDGLQAIDAYRRLRPDITLMDLQMPRLGGLEAINRIRSEFPSARIIVLTTYAGDALALRALRAGAMGYVLKAALGTELLETIRTVHEGRRHIPPEIAQEIALRSGEESLSEREIGVLTLLSKGYSNKQVASALSISQDTVKGHLKSIFAKLEVRDRTEAARLAVRRGIIDP
ncbi:DNA-binding NarL/FixJ family response regulator [Lysobacter sp. OAE881]|uniref:response regulator n=1 Tax=Lysobacter sp. OAE881 TaxID=2663813 RepID=UPI00178BEF8D